MWERGLPFLVGPLGAELGSLGSSFRQALPWLRKVSDRQVFDSRPPPLPPPAVFIHRRSSYLQGCWRNCWGLGWVPIKDPGLRFKLVSAPVSPLTICLASGKSVSSYLKWG